LLLVEDSQRLQRSLGLGLRRLGYALDTAADGPEGLRLAESNAYDVVILDLMLPGLDGLSVLRRLREGGGDAHVLILTARDTIDDRVRGLQTGADDFLVKPFAFAELLARVQALVRRRHGQKNPRVVVGPLEIDTAARTVCRQGAPLALTPREYALLEYLAAPPGPGGDPRRDRGAPLRGAHRAQQQRGRLGGVRPAAAAGSAGQASLIETRRGLGYVFREPP
jgi:DNA-binding response OmpR family regulator